MTAAYAVQNLDDPAVFTTLVPGFLAGIFFVGVYAFGQRRVRDRHRVARILRKVRDTY